MEPKMKFRDCSPWHHLVFVEELADNVGIEANCRLCDEQAVGPVYKCLECSFIQHKSCPKPTRRNWEERMKKHYFRPRHHLILVEEVENKAEQEIVCWGCKEPASLPAYKCSFPGCTFFLHKSCTELSHVVLHLLHSDHVLTLQTKEEKCNFCLKTKKSLLYSCYPCDFHIHSKCISHIELIPRWPVIADDCHEHAVLTTPMRDPFTCQACGEESHGTAYSCLICRLTMERRCCDFPHFIQITLHGHPLIFIHSVCLIIKEQRVFCKLCRKQVNTRYGAYFCTKCGYILHLQCARRYEEKGSTFKSMFGSCDEYTIYLLEWSKVLEDKRIVELEKIKHFNHPQHDLILSHEDPGYDKKCEACVHFIFFAPYYGCVECNFFLHIRCAKLPTTIKRGLFHKHPLTLISQVSLWKSHKDCNLCYRYREGYVYECGKCDGFKLDVPCALLPEVLEHHLHQHILFLVGRFETYGVNCKGCNSSFLAYVCIDDCKFALCKRCVTFPPIVRYRYHPHYLKLTFTCDDEDQEENYCLICEEKRYGKRLFYWCEECDFTVHTKCILGIPFKLGRYVNGNHQHPLTLVETTKDSPPCKACGESFYNTRGILKRYSDKTIVECTQCKFFIHKRCQIEMFSKSS